MRRWNVWLRRLLRLAAGAALLAACACSPDGAEVVSVEVSSTDPEVQHGDPSSSSTTHEEHGWTTDGSTPFSVDATGLDWVERPVAGGTIWMKQGLDWVNEQVSVELFVLEGMPTPFDPDELARRGGIARDYIEADVCGGSVIISYLPGRLASLVLAEPMSGDRAAIARLSMVSQRSPLAELVEVHVGELLSIVGLNGRPVFDCDVDELRDHTWPLIADLVSGE